MSKLKNTYGFSDDVLKAVLDVHVNEASLSPKQKDIAKLAGDPEEIDAKDLEKLRKKAHHKKSVQEARTALDKTYPHGANDMATLAVQLRALLNFFSKSGIMKKIMREHVESFDFQMNDTKLLEMTNYVTSLIEELQPVKPNNSNPDLKMTCSNCGGSKSAVSSDGKQLMYADVEAKPFTYICHNCADDKK